MTDTCKYTKEVLYNINDYLLMRFATRTEQLTICCDLLQKRRVRLELRKIDLSPQVILYYLSFQGDISVVILFVLCRCRIFVLFEP